MKRLHVAITLLLALFALDLQPAQPAAQPHAPNYVADEVIVRYRDGVEESQKDLARFRVFGNRKKVFKTVRGLEVIKLPQNLSVQEAIDLYEQDQTSHAEPNYIIHLTAKPELTATPNDPSFGSLWGLTKISAPNAWNITTGSGNVVVATLDTGIDYNHPDLSANVWRNTADCNKNGIDDDGTAT
jgi:subtilisin family serine protease